MNRKSQKMLLLALLLALVAPLMQATTYSVPKREFRSAWVATVWALDWPTIGQTAEYQQAELTRLLDSLQVNHFNAVNFQVRSMCDAMYQSSYEPWSSYLTGTRGKDPGYDPLQFIVEECHKRGMECHAWINPYRFSTGSNWNTTQDQTLKNDGWLLTHGSTIILDPGQQRTIDRIVAVCKEVITKYDVDGILYDDYFYPDGISSDSSAGDYEEWQSSGTSLSLGDWRRDNVNRMVQAVYDMIQQTRPEVRFGISPAGVAATSSTVASKYGVTTCPSGSDWQYNGIFSDPLAWLQAQSIDYISPQVYWKMGNSKADYSKITPWWGTVAAKFGRHVYISSSISSLSAKSTTSDYTEYSNQVELNRTSSEDGNPGAIFYSCKYLYRMNAETTLAHHLKNTVFTHAALPPVITWKQGNNPGLVTNVQYSGNTLSWQGYDNVRYTVYAFPATIATTDFNHEVEYLLGMSYETTYTIPDEYAKGYQYAICVLDRVGNEYDAAFYSLNLEQLEAPVLISPAAGATVDSPFDFTWHKVTGATKYTVETSDSQDFSIVKDRVTVTDTIANSTLFTGLTTDVEQYWRVRASADDHYDGVSEARAIIPRLLHITYPENGAEDVDPAFTAEWYAVGSTDEVTIEIATTETFDSIVFTGASATQSLAVTPGLLVPGQTYYIRARLVVDGVELISPIVMFVCAHVPPTFVTPVDGGVLYGTDYVTIAPQIAVTQTVIEISASPTVWARTRYVETLGEGVTTSSKLASEIKVSSNLLVNGQTYYARARASYVDELNATHSTGYGDTISFVYYTTPPLKGDVNLDGKVDAGDIACVVSIITGLQPAGTYGIRDDVNSDGVVDSGDIAALVSIIVGIE